MVGPALLAALFLHGTMGPFMGLIAIHELQHRTVFRTRWLNPFFEVLYAFISWSDYLWYRESTSSITCPRAIVTMTARCNSPCASA